MDNNRPIFGAAANFEGCLEVIRVNTETGKCDILGQSVKPAANGPALGRYFAGLAESGWIYPADYETYSHIFELSCMKERLTSGTLILNGIRVKPADTYLWTDFELIRPKSCPHNIFIFVRSLKHKYRPALKGYNLLMRLDFEKGALYPIAAPFDYFNDFRGALESCAAGFGTELSALSGTDGQLIRSGDHTFELSPCRGAGSSGFLAAVYETDAVSEERQMEVFDCYKKIDAETGLYAEYYVKNRADMSGDPYIGAMLISSEGIARDKAVMILKCDFADSAFVRGEQLALLLTAGSISRLRHCFGALCRRFADTGCDFMVRISLSVHTASAEEILYAADKSEPQTPRDFRWSVVGEVRETVSL